VTAHQPDPAPGAEPERGFVVAVLSLGADAEDELAELQELARTAGVEPVDALTQHRARPDPRSYVGKGKLAELKEQEAAPPPPPSASSPAPPSLAPAAAAPTPQPGSVAAPAPEPANGNGNGNGGRSLGVGLENLEQRLRRFGGHDATVVAGRRPHGGFEVRMRWRLRERMVA